MRLLSFLVILLLIVIAALVYFIYWLPPRVTVVERPVVEYVTGPRWIPWEWGAGTYGWPGSFYINRPVPHFYMGGGGRGGRFVGTRPPPPPAGQKMMPHMK